MKKKFYISHLVLCLFLILFGAGFAYFMLSNLFRFVSPFSFVTLLYYIPTLLLGSVLPLYGGISYLIHIIKGKDSSMYPPPDNTASDLIDQFDQFTKKNNSQE